MSPEWVHPTATYCCSKDRNPLENGVVWFPCCIITVSLCVDISVRTGSLNKVSGGLALRTVHTGKSFEIFE